MKIKPVRLKFFIIIIMSALIFGNYKPLQATQDTSLPLDIVVKISRLENTLNVIDNLAGADPKQPMKSPTALLKGMLQGTGWIDSNRLIVIGIKINETKSEIAVLIPFQQPNNNFQAAFNALAGPDYYIVSLPPGKGGAISDAVEAALVDASRADEKISLSAELAVNELLEKGDEKIKQGLAKLENLPRKQKLGGTSLTLQQIREIQANMLDTLGQIEVLTIGIDFSEEKLTIVFKGDSLDGSPLAKLFTQKGETTLLDGYKPEKQINFRSRSYDITGMVALINSIFGKLYESMGIDFSDLAAISGSFTGEMTGGMSFGQTGIIFEMIGVLKDPNKAADFLEAVYLPWLMKYSQNITNMMEKQLGMKMEQIYIRTSDSTVDGHKVIGVKMQFPLFPPSMKTPETKKMSSLMKFESRMTTVGNLFLTAPNDKRMGELIKISKKLEERPAKGPLMSMDVDMAEYFNAIAEMMPELSAGREPLPKMGKINILIDINNGQVIETASIMMDDIRTLISHFKKITTSGKAAMEKKAPEEMQKAEKKYVPEKDAVFWLGKGALCATYGNDKLAIKYFKKAIELDPQKSEAYFQIGISYGETGEYQEAISSINKALKLGPNKGLYYYGRGRIYLLSGDKEKAIEDFKHAATIGNKDAQNYLQNVAHIPWE